MKITIALTLAILASPVLSHQAFAAPAGAPQVAVRYADLDLSLASDRQKLERRVATAVERVCPARPEATELARLRIYKACHETTLSAASQQLQAVYAQNERALAPLQLASDRR